MRIMISWVFSGPAPPQEIPLRAFHESGGLHSEDPCAFEGVETEPALDLFA